MFWRVDKCFVSHATWNSPRVRRSIMCNWKFLRYDHNVRDFQFGVTTDLYLHTNFPLAVQSPNLPIQPSQDEPILCSEGFFYDVNGTGSCRPECGRFEKMEHGLVIFQQLCIGLCLLATVLMVLLALTVQRSTLWVNLTFSAILLPYWALVESLLTNEQSEMIRSSMITWVVVPFGNFLTHSLHGTGVCWGYCCFFLVCID